MTITTTVLPPEISFSFSRDLLTIKQGIERTLEKLSVYQEMAIKLYGSNSRKMKEFNNTINAFLEFYEWYKKRKAYQNSTHKKEKEKPYFEANKIHHFRGELRAFFLELFRNGELSGFFSENNDISKV